MKLNVYSIYDQTAKAYITPFFMHNDAMAVRAFSDNINKGEDSQLSLHPDQFTLYRIGEYDDVTGILISHDPESLGTAERYIQDSRSQLDIDDIHRKLSNIDMRLSRLVTESVSSDYHKTAKSLGEVS